MLSSLFYSIVYHLLSYLFQDVKLFVDTFPDGGVQTLLYVSHSINITIL